MLNCETESSSEDKDQLLERLKHEIEKEKHNCNLAAMFGKQLLDEKQNLIARLDKVTADYTATIEKLEQEKYSLQLQLDSKSAIEGHQAAEIEALLTDMKKLSDEKEQLEKTKNDLNGKLQEIREQHDHLDQAHNILLSNETALQKKIQLLEKQLEEFREISNQSFTSEISSDDIKKLQNDIQGLMIEKQELEKALHESLERNAAISESKKAIEKQCLMKDEEIADKDKELAFYSASFEKSQTTILELQAEMESLKLQQTDVNSRGNSLFAEVDDRRRELERRYESLLLKHKTAKEENEFYRQQYQKARAQMATLMSTMTGKIDEEYLRSLEDSLAQARWEIRNLGTQLHEAEKESEKLKTQCEKLKQKLSGQESVSEGGAGTDYEYLSIMLEQSRKELSNLKEELRQIRMEKLLESEALIECQRKLRSAETDARIHKAEVMSLKVKLKELSNADEIQKPVKPRIVTEKLPGFENKGSFKAKTDSSSPEKENQKPSVVNQASRTDKRVTLSSDVIVTSADGEQQKQALHDEEGKPGLECEQRKRKQHSAGRRAVAPCFAIGKSSNNNECNQQ